MLDSSGFPYRRVVVKIGAGVLSDPQGQLDRAALQRLVGEVSVLARAGIEVVVVTSGAVVTGRSVLSSLARDIPDRQAYAAIGQPRLMHAYQELAQQEHLNVAQLLITREDFDHRARYLNIRNTIHALLKMKVLPVVNENDVVAITVEGGDAFGGNDALAAMVALLADADLLLILGQTDGILDAPPESGRAKRIPEIKNISQELFAVVGKGSPTGRGGMRRKLEAAKLAADSGILTIIANGREEKVMERIILKSEQRGTRCLPSREYYSSRDRWLVGGVVQKGSVTIDAKAVDALRRGASLLPVGILTVNGDFQRGDAIRVLNEAGESVAVGLTNYASGDLDKIKRLSSRDIGAVLGYRPSDEAIHNDNLALTSCILTFGKS